MKHFFVFTFATLLSLSFASVSWASTVSFDVWGDGELQIEDSCHKRTTDFSQYAIGIEVPTERTKFTVNLSKGELDISKYGKIDTASILLKNGYSLIDNSTLRCDVTAGLYGRKLNFDPCSPLGIDPEAVSVYSIIIGCNIKLMMSQKAWLDFNYNWGISPRLEITYSDNGYLDGRAIDAISLLSLKSNYLFTSKLGASLGFLNERIELDSDEKYTLPGFTVGVFYKF